MLPARDYFLLDGRSCTPLSYWSPTPVHRLTIGDSFSKYLPLSHPHSAGISAFFHASRRRYCVVAIKHVSGGRDFLPLSPGDISNLALALADLASCYCSPHLLKVGAYGLAQQLGACSSRTSIFLILHTVLLFYQSLQRYDTRPAHNSLVYSVQHVFPAHRWTERSSR